MDRPQPTSPLASLALGALVMLVAAAVIWFVKGGR